MIRVLLTSASLGEKYAIIEKKYNYDKGDLEFNHMVKKWRAKVACILSKSTGMIDSTNAKSQTTGFKYTIVTHINAMHMDIKGGCIQLEKWSGHFLENLSIF